MAVQGGSGTLRLTEGAACNLTMLSQFDEKERMHGALSFLRPP